MIRHPEIWEIIRSNLPTDRFMPLNEMYELVEHQGNLDNEDFEPQSPTSDMPKWKRNVRNVLQYRKRTGDIEWNHDAGYRLMRER